ncbi:hypothetical protein CW354_07800 [Marinicaulis flavus]|uniref:Uncharacterized protein n=2 Tax=Hyphococcus luteus TaxID=2058213 RepID=A0A2S7K6V9_9PROT|nr:hypothetical protein CW354_07800 [Marinicaulis flavus]
MKVFLAAWGALSVIATQAMAGEDSLRPEVIEWGASAADIEKSLEGKCANGFVNRPIDPPFLQNVEDKQVQIDCDGLDFLGAPRWTEFVIGDDRLQMVWVMVDAEDRDTVLKALQNAYGEPSHQTDMFTAFVDHRAAWREEPPEVLFYSGELDAGMRSWFDNPN